jgi:aminopeptidase N
MEKLNKDGTKSWHYRLSKPHAPYLIMLGIGKYAVKSIQSKSGVPIHLWYYPEYPERIEPTYEYSTEMMDWFENELGVKYPWGSYAQIPVQDYTFGAMENTSATLFGDFYHVDEGGAMDRAYLYVNAHELTHQWFGDLITERTETHHWLHENFATYYGNLYTGTVKGMDTYDWSRKTAIDQALEASKKDLLPIAHSKAGTARHYPKGAVVLDMLRYVTGEVAFKRSIRYFLEKHAYQNVDSEDLLIAFHEKTGLSLDWFWEQWIYRGGEPKYEVSFQEIEKDGQKYNEFSVTQSHETTELVKLFNMPVQLQVFYTDGSCDSITHTIDKYSQIIRIPNKAGKKVDFVLFDPNMKIIKSINFTKSYEMLAAQFTKAKNMLDRYEALMALKSLPLNQKQKMLQERFYQESFYALKAEIVNQLAQGITEPTIKKLIIDALSDTHAEVKKAAIAAIKAYDIDLITALEKTLQDKSYLVKEQCLEKLCILHPAQKQVYLNQVKDVVGVRGSNVRVKWLELNAQENMLAYGSQLAHYAGNSYEFITRINAMNALKRLNYLDTIAVKGIIDALLNPNTRLSNEASASIKHFVVSTAYKQLFEKYTQSQTWETWQKSILQKSGLN